MKILESSQTLLAVLKREAVSLSKRTVRGPAALPPRSAADLAQAGCEHTPGRGGPGRAQAGQGRVLCRLLGQGLMAGIGSLGETPRPLVAAAGLRPQIGRPDRGRQPNHAPHAWIYFQLFSTCIDL